MSLEPFVIVGIVLAAIGLRGTRPRRDAHSFVATEEEFITYVHMRAEQSYIPSHPKVSMESYVIEHFTELCDGFDACSGKIFIIADEKKVKKKIIDTYKLRNDLKK